MSSPRTGRAHTAPPPHATRVSGHQITRTIQFATIALVLAVVPAHESKAGVTMLAGPLAMLEHRRILSYPLDQVWTTAIRYLRIDRGFELTDRDEESGYLLFEFTLAEGGVGSGSLQMFATVDVSGRPSASVQINTAAGPLHLPNSLLDGLAAKVRSERGQPKAPPTPEPPPEQDKPEDDNGVPLLPPAQDP